MKLKFHFHCALYFFLPDVAQTHTHTRTKEKYEKKAKTISELEKQERMVAVKNIGGCVSWVKKTWNLHKCLFICMFVFGSVRIMPCNYGNSNNRVKSTIAFTNSSMYLFQLWRFCRPSSESNGFVCVCDDGGDIDGGVLHIEWLCFFASHSHKQSVSHVTCIWQQQQKRKNHNSK